MVDFYGQKASNRLNQLVIPKNNGLRSFDKIAVETIKLPTIFKRHNAPYFIKVDLSHCNKLLLKELFDNGITPTYISVEAHNPLVLDILTANSHYVRYNALLGRNMGDLYPSFARKGDDNVGPAGPLAPHLKSPWLDVKGIKTLFEDVPFGWIDIYASTDAIIPTGKIDYSFYLHENTINVLE